MGTVPHGYAPQRCVVGGHSFLILVLDSEKLATETGCF